jgi:hypothetical protein
MHLLACLAAASVQPIIVRELALPQPTLARMNVSQHAVVPLNPTKK